MEILPPGWGMDGFTDATSNWGPSAASPIPANKRNRTLFIALTPLPIPNLRHVLAVARDVQLMLDQPRTQRFLEPRGVLSQTGYPVDDISGEVKPIQVVQHSHVERRRSGAFFFVAAHMHIVVIRAPIGQSVDQPGIAVKCEHDGLVLGEDRIELVIVHSMRVLAWRLKRHQVYDVHHADFEMREMLP